MSSFATLCRRGLVPQGVVGVTAARLVGERNPLQPKYPIDAAAELKAPVLVLFCGADEGIPPELVERMRKALAAGAK